MTARRLAPPSLLLALLLLTAATAPASAAGIDHAPFDRLLRARVKAGRVDYSGIRASAADRAALQAYVAAVGQARLDGLDQQARLAFYLNAYNALVIKGVVDRLPAIRSVMKVKGFFDGIKHRVAGRAVTLNQLENEIIRPTFKEPRIHFALVCGARSCPPLRPAAFGARGLDGALERLTRAFINTPTGVTVKAGRVEASQIFSWYAQDFVDAAGSVGKYLARYHAKAAPLLARTGKPAGFLPYSWALNGR